MAPRVPERYTLEVRLGADGDIEEWLATDQPLDRPVLLRLLEPDATETRRTQFLDQVRAAAAITHTHIATTYAAGTDGPTTYSVSEWAGGVSLADRAAAGEPIPPEEFLPNAAGLSSALAALHDGGVIHGAVDAEAVIFSAAHPAKLARFGTQPRWRTPEEDVQALAAVLEVALTGRPIGAALPSQVVDTITTHVDRALEHGRTGEVDANQLASELRSAPLLSPRRRRFTGWSWTWVRAAAALFATATVLILIGSSINQPTDSVAVPSTVVSSSSTALPSTTSAPASPTPTTAPLEPVIVSAAAYDPFGTDGEHDELADRSFDGDFATSWRTESYLSPLPLLKSGVGVAFVVDGSVSGVEISGARDGTTFELYWAATSVSSFEEWNLVSQGSISDGGADLSVPPTDGGNWLVWLTDLPATNEGTYLGTISEVRFRS